MDKKKQKTLKGVSLFSSAGIGEAFFDKIGIKIVVANELIAERAKLYSSLYKDSNMIIGDITDKKIFNKIVKESGKIDFLIATPPCQGVSIAGKNRTMKQMLNDERNHLIFKTIDLINIKKPKFVLIENVPNFLKLKLPYEGKLCTLLEILSALYGSEYKIEAKVLDASEFGVPQKRNRALIKMYKKGLIWKWPAKSKVVSVKDAIAFLPSLNPGQKSDIPWHFARRHSPQHILCMKNTPTGCSAFQNKIHFPKKSSGERVKGYMTTYRRIKWNEPAPTITMRNDAISSQLNVHPGRKLKDGTYSDPRVLTPLELMLLSSFPVKDKKIPENTPEILIRKCIGEGVPPLLLKKVLLGIEI
ncbi:MAG: DNA (cytosine-5-)-methyltransferase [Patescibacteria group bacterium]